MTRSKGLRRNVDWRDNYIPEPNCGCHIWMGWTNGKYGMVTLNKQKHLAHRLFYEMDIGPIPDGMCVCHHCDNPLCVNALHMFVGTHSDNSIDMMRKKREPDQVGENGPKARLTWEQVVAIRAVPYKHGVYEKLAAQYGVCGQTISDIYNGRRWNRARRKIY